MPTNEVWIPSRRMQAAALSERSKLERELRRLAGKEEELARKLANLRATRGELQDRVRVLNRLLHGVEEGGRESPHQVGPVRAVPRANGAQREPDQVVLRGAHIRETAVRALAASTHGTAPVHYRSWYELLTKQGFIPAGKDPVATFLTQIGRSPLVRRSTAAGTYSLDFEFPRRARARLEQLRLSLARMHELAPDATVEEISSARERRAHLAKEIGATERALEEAVRSLGEG